MTTYKISKGQETWTLYKSLLVGTSICKLVNVSTEVCHLDYYTLRTLFS